MQNNIISFDRARKSARRAPRAAAAGTFRDNVVSLADWKARSHTRRTAGGVFFSTCVLTTAGTAA